MSGSRPAGTHTLAELAELFNVSRTTVRRKLGKDQGWRLPCDQLRGALTG